MTGRQISEAFGEVDFQYCKECGSEQVHRDGKCIPCKVHSLEKR